MITLLEKLKNRNKADYIKTGILSLDLVLDGGLERGKTAEVYSLAAVGKTSLALQVCKENPELIILYFTFEDIISNIMLKNRGVNKDNIYFCNRGLATDFVSTLLSVFDSELCPDILIIDSFSSICPDTETLDNAYSYKQLRWVIRELSTTITNSGCACLLLNQNRSQIGKEDQTTGGKAITDFCNTRIKLINAGPINHEYNRVGNLVKFKVDKQFSKLSKYCYADLDYLSGFNTSKVILDLALWYKLIENRGAVYFYNNNYTEPVKIGRGKIQASKYIENNKEVKLKLEEKITEKYKQSIL